MSLFAPVNIVLAILSWWKMGYLVFNVIGANKLLSGELRHSHIVPYLNPLNPARLIAEYGSSLKPYSGTRPPFTALANWGHHRRLLKP